MQACWCSLAGTKACNNCRNNYMYGWSTGYSFQQVSQTVPIFNLPKKEKELENTFEIVKRSDKKKNGTD